MKGPKQIKWAASDCLIEDFKVQFARGFRVSLNLKVGATETNDRVKSRKRTFADLRTPRAVL